MTHRMLGLCCALSVLTASAPAAAAGASVAGKRAEPGPQHAAHVRKPRRKAAAHRARHPRAIYVPTELPDLTVFKPSAVRSVGWMVTLSAKSELSPQYTGGRRYGGAVFPGLSFNRPGVPVVWSSPDDSLDISLFGTQRFSIGPAFNFRGGRYRYNEGGALYGLHKVRWTVESGLFADYWAVPDALRFHAELRRGFRKEDGLVADLGADWVTRWDKFTLGIGPRAKFAAGHFMNDQFGVTDADAAANPRLAPYKPGGGLYALGAYGSLTYKQNESWSYTLHGGYDRMMQEAARSPVMRVGGSRNQFQVGLSVNYTFHYGKDYPWD